MIYIRKHDVLRLVSLIGGNGRFCEISFEGGAFSIDSFCQYRLIVRCPGKASERCQKVAAIVKTSALAAAIAMCSSVVELEFLGDKVVVAGNSCRTALKAIPIRHDYQKEENRKHDDIFIDDFPSVAASVSRSCNVLSSSHANRRSIRIKRDGAIIKIIAANDTEACIGSCAIARGGVGDARLDACIPPQAVISLYSASLGAPARIRMTGRIVEISTRTSDAAAIYVIDNNHGYPAIEIRSGAQGEDDCTIKKYKILSGNAKYMYLAERSKLDV